MSNPESDWDIYFNDNNNLTPGDYEVGNGINDISLNGDIENDLDFTPIKEDTENIVINESKLTKIINEAIKSNIIYKMENNVYMINMKLFLILSIIIIYFVFCIICSIIYISYNESKKNDIGFNTMLYYTMLYSLAVIIDAIIFMGVTTLIITLIYLLFVKILKFIKSKYSNS